MPTPVKKSVSKPVAEPDAGLAASANPPRIAIVGAGRTGLEAALYAQRCGLAARVFESGDETAPRLRAVPHVGLLSTWDDLRTSLGLAAAKAYCGRRARTPAAGVYPTVEQVLRLYIDSLAGSLAPKCLWLNHRVAAVGRAYLGDDELADRPEERAHAPFRILTRNTATGEERMWSAEYLLDCTGGGKAPSWSGPGGLPAIGESGCNHLIRRLPPDASGRDRSLFAGKKTLLAGSTVSAALAAVGLADLAAKHEGTQFYWAVRQPASGADLPFDIAPAAARNRRDLLLSKANLLVRKSPGFLVYSPDTSVEDIRYHYESSKFLVTLQVGRVTKRFQFDNLVSHPGVRWDATYQCRLCPGELGFAKIGADRCPSALDPVAYSRAAEIESAFRTLLGDATLNHYSSP